MPLRDSVDGTPHPRAQRSLAGTPMTCMNEWMNEWMIEWMKEGRKEWMNQWIKRNEKNWSEMKWNKKEMKWQILGFNCFWQRVSREDLGRCWRQDLVAPLLGLPQGNLGAGNGSWTSCVLPAFSTKKWGKCHETLGKIWWHSSNHRTTKTKA